MWRRLPLYKYVGSIQFQMSFYFVIVTTSVMLVVLSLIVVTLLWQRQNCRLWHLLIPTFRSGLSNFISNQSYDKWLIDNVENVNVQSNVLGLSISVNITSDEIAKALIIDPQGFVQAYYPISEKSNFVGNKIINLIDLQDLSLITKFQPAVIRKGAVCIVSIPFLEEQNPLWFVLISKPVNELSVFSFSGILIAIILSLPVTTLVGSVFGWFVSKPLVKRFRKIARAVNHWAQGKFDLLIEETKNDEIGNLIKDLNYMSEQMQQLLVERQELAASQERNRLARDLHDSIKQHVFAVSMQIATARHHLRENFSVDQVDRILENTEYLLGDIRQELTSVIYRLKLFSINKKNTFFDDLSYHLREWASQAGIQLVLDIQSTIEVSQGAEEEFYYIFQEAMSNVLRHSKAKKVEISILQDHSNIFISISDDGIGFNFQEQRKKGLGLCNIQERIESLGGKFEVISQPNEGTRLVIIIPTESRKEVNLRRTKNGND